MSGGKYKELTLNTALFAISSFGQKFVSFLLLPLYTAALSTADYGRVDLVTSTASLLIPVLTLNVQDAVLRFGLGQDADSEEVLSVGIRSIGIGSCVLIFALALMKAFGLQPFDDSYLVFLFIMFLTGAATNILTNYLKVCNHVKSLVISGVGSTLVTCLFAVLLLVVFPCGIIGYMVAMSLGNSFSVLYLSIAGRLSPGLAVKRTPKGLSRAMAAYSAPLVLNSVAWWVNNVSDRYILTLICGAAANGIYAVAYKIPTILSTFQSIFYNAWSISAIKEFSKDDSDGFLGNMYSLYACAMSIGCSALLILDIPLASLLYSNDFFEAWRYVPFLLVGTVYNGLALFEGCLFSAARRTKEVSRTTIIGSISGLLSCVLLTLAIGPMGAAIATFVGYFVTWATRTWLMRRDIVRIKVSWPIEFGAMAALIAQAVAATGGTHLFTQVLLLLAVVAMRYKQIAKFIKLAINKLKNK